MSIRHKSDLKVANLSQENRRLAKDIEKMEAVLERHRFMLDSEAKSLRGQIRKEVGGSKWIAGAKGQMTGYKSSKALNRQETAESKSQKESVEDGKKFKNRDNRKFQKPSSGPRTATSTKDEAQKLEDLRPIVQKCDRGSGDAERSTAVRTAAVPKKSSDRQARTVSARGKGIKTTSARMPSGRGSGGSEFGSASTSDRTGGKARKADEEPGSVTPYSERIAVLKSKVLSKASAKVKLTEKRKQGDSSSAENRKVSPRTGEGRDVPQDSAEKWRGESPAGNSDSVTLSDRSSSSNETGSENGAKPEVIKTEKLNNVSTHNEVISVTVPRVEDCQDDEDDERESSSTDRSEEEQHQDRPILDKHLNVRSSLQSSGSDSQAKLQGSYEGSVKGITGQKLNNEGTTKRQAPPPQKDPILYDPALSVWVYSLKLLDTDKYIKIFVDNEVTMEGVKLLDETHLKEMGITAMGPLSKISHGIKVLRGEVEEGSLPSSRGNADGASESASKEIEPSQKPARSGGKDAAGKDVNVLKGSREFPDSTKKSKNDNAADSKASAGSERSTGKSAKTAEAGKDGRRVKSAATVRGNKEDVKNAGKSSRPVSASVAQRSLASGVRAASHKLKKKKELQEQESKRQEKLTKMKKAERDKMAAQFHSKKRAPVIPESSSRKSSTSDADGGSGHSSDGGVEDLLTVYTKGLLGTHTRANTSSSSKPDSPSKTKTSLYPQKPPKSDRVTPATVADTSTSLLVQGDQLIEPTTTRDSNRSSRRAESQHSNRSSEISPLTSQEDRLKELEIQVLGLQQKGTDSSHLTIEMVDRLQRQLHEIQEDLAGKMTQSNIQDEQGGEKEVAVETPKPEKARPKGSASVSKRELMRKVRKQNEHHRKQIRHLEAELNRLKHKDPMRSCEIPEEDVRFSEADLIGEGAFSQVFRGSYHGSEVAIKRLKTPLSVQDKNYFAEEVNLMRELRHPRVVLLLGVCTTSRLPLMVLEYMSNGSLYSWLHDPHRPPLDHISYFQVARDTSLGMNYLHRHKPVVLHMDLKSMNVLIGSHGRAKIGDFGFSKLRHDADVAASQSGGSMRGTPAWMAPELLDPTIGEVTTKVDVYSFGIILWEMFTRQHPYQGLSVFQIMERVRLNKRPEIPENCPGALDKLINMCWEQKPNKRPSFKDILISLEGLSFPPEWRDLFAAAGIPREAMDDAHSARSIIDLVNKSVGMTETELATGVQVVPQLALSLSQDDDDDVGVGFGELAAEGLPKGDIDVDSVSSDDEWVATAPVKESIDDFVLNIPQSVLDAMKGSYESADGHATMEGQDCRVNSAQIVDEDSGLSRGGKVSARSVKSERGTGISPTLGKSPGRSVKFADQGDDELSRRSAKTEKSTRSSTAWEDEPRQDAKMRGSAVPPPPPPVPDLSQSLSITQGARRKPPTSFKSTQPVRRTVATVVAPTAGHITIPVSELLKQKARLKPATDPHPNQLADLTRLSQGKLTSIAEILKKAVTERRTAMREDTASIEHSYPSGAWSLEEGL